MMAKRRPPPPASKPQPSLPHDHDREGGQPYAKEVEDYKRGVASPPEEQVANEGNRSSKKPVARD
jgi:hypothetical protein